MFKPSQIFSAPYRRLRMTTKRGPKKGYYKGTGTGTVGTHTKWGGFMVDYSRVRTYVCPYEAVTTSQLRPFVARLIEEPKREKNVERLAGGQIFLKRWKEENGET